MQLIPARLIRALDTLRENKTAKVCVVLTRKPDAELNDILNGRSNNSLDASGFSALLMGNLNESEDPSRRVNSGVRPH